MNGVNGVILLTGRGTRIIDTGHGDMAADVIPVDFAVRTILSCAATMQPPPATFVLPMTDDTKPDTTPERSSSTPIAGKSRDSISSHSSVSTAVTSPMTSTTKHFTPNAFSEPSLDCFPYIYHVSAMDLRAISWRLAYDAIRFYWIRATGVNLAPSQSYFTASAQGLSRARTVMNSLRSAATGYMSNSNNTITSTANGSPDTATRRSARPSNKRSSHRMSKYVDKAARLAPNVMRSYTVATTTVTSDTTPTKSRLVNNNAASFSGGSWMLQLKNQLHDAADTTFDPYYLVAQDASTSFWMDYFTNASYGMHYFVGAEPNVRLPTPLTGWNCALQQQGISLDVIDHQVGSEIFSPDQVAKRTQRMIEHLKRMLVQDELAAPSHQLQQQQHEEWLIDFDDSLEDWCQDQTVINAEHDKRLVLGKWRKKVGSNDDAVKVVVLNDKRVNQAIHQVSIGSTEEEIAAYSLF